MSRPLMLLLLFAASAAGYSTDTTRRPTYFLARNARFWGGGGFGAPPAGAAPPGMEFGVAPPPPMPFPQQPWQPAGLNGLAGNVQMPMPMAGAGNWPMVEQPGMMGPSAQPFWPQANQWPVGETLAPSPMSPMAQSHMRWGQLPSQTPMGNSWTGQSTSQWLPSTLGTSPMSSMTPWQAPGTIIGGPQLGPQGPWFTQKAEPLPNQPLFAEQAHGNPAMHSGQWSAAPARPASSNAPVWHTPMAVVNGWQRNNQPTFDPASSWGASAGRQSFPEKGQLGGHYRSNGDELIEEAGWSTAASGSAVPEMPWRKTSAPQVPPASAAYPPPFVREAPNYIDAVPVLNAYHSSVKASSVVDQPISLSGRDPAIAPSAIGSDKRQTEEAELIDHHHQQQQQQQQSQQPQPEDPYAQNPNILLGGPVSMAFPEMELSQVGSFPEQPLTSLQQQPQQTQAKPSSPSTGSLSPNTVRIGQILSFPQGTSFGALPPPSSPESNANGNAGSLASSRAQHVHLASLNLQDDVVLQQPRPLRQPNVISLMSKPASSSSLGAGDKPIGARTLRTPKPGQADVTPKPKPKNKSVLIKSTTTASMTDAILQQIQELKVVLYGVTNCSGCQETEALLKNYTVPVYYFELDVVPNGGKILTAVQQMTHSTERPLTFICGRFVGGYQRLLDLHNNNQIVPLLRDCFPLKLRAVRRAFQ